MLGRKVMDDYSTDQTRRDQEYREAWDSPETRAWIESLDAEEISSACAAIDSIFGVM